MAITGTGTQADPYLFSSYDEMRAVCSNPNYRGGYARLTCDINCEDYGDDWEWVGFTVFPSVDLGGHTIRNAVITQASSMFVMQSSNIAEKPTIMKNGRILNIFNNYSDFIFMGEYGNHTIFENMQFSMNINTLRQCISQFINFKKCSFYIAASVLSCDMINLESPSYGMQSNVMGCDFWFNIKDLNGKRIIGSSSGSVDSSRNSFESCRFQGKMEGGVRTNCLFSNYNERIKISSCVWAVDTSGTVYDHSSETGDRLMLTPSSVGVIDSEVSPFAYPSGLIEMTSEGIRDCDTLNGVGFAVLQV